VLTDAEALALAEDPAPDLAGLCADARARRDAAYGVVVTYSPKVFIPLTMLCRDVCHYCTFTKPPKKGERSYLTPDEVVALAEQGKAAGCREALFTLGDKPELRYEAARLELAELGFETTVAYLVHCMERVLTETGLLPHANPGILSDAELAATRAWSPSQGIMLETASARLSEKGMPHYGSPDKEPAVRLDALRRMGALKIPTTSGILIGIGETRREQVEALLALRDLHAEHGHLQEVIVQNFRAKAGTKMVNAPEPSLDEHLWTLAVARLILPDEVSLQAPPNLAHADFPRLLEAGINDWGGVSPVTPDHVNPEAPWPELAALEARTAEAGHTLLPRLTVYPRFLNGDWLEPTPLAAALKLADGQLRSRPHDGWVNGISQSPPAAWSDGPPARLGGISTPFAQAIKRAEAEEILELEDTEALLTARGPELTRLVELADQRRWERAGDDVTYVVCRNINYTNVCYFKCGFCAFSKGRLAENLRGPAYLLEVDEVARRSVEAYARGGTEVCLQGGIHPGFTGEWYLDVLRAVKAAQPEIHIHAFSPLEVWQGAATMQWTLADYLRQLKEAGLGSMPGTAAEILDDEVRAVLCPDKVNTEQWLEVMRTAHSVGVRTTATIMFGHIERPIHVARHLHRIRDLQRETGGFTEFVPLPFVPEEAPIALKGRARYGPTFDETIALHATARLALDPWIPSIQTSWVKLGPEGARHMLSAGVNDLGGTLMDESISRAAGAAHGQECPPERMDAIIAAAGRDAYQRTTLYGRPPEEQVARSYGAPPLADTTPPAYDDQGLKRPDKLIRPGLAIR
jgi:FO synthase